MSLRATCRLLLPAASCRSIILCCCRLVNGFTLSQYIKWRKSEASVLELDHESNVLTVAVQLLEVQHVMHTVRTGRFLCHCKAHAPMSYGSDKSSALQTVAQLHDRAHIAHSDLKPENIMLSQNSQDPWKSLKLLDFGFADKCSSGKLSSEGCGCLNCFMRPIFLV